MMSSHAATFANTPDYEYVLTWRQAAAAGSAYAGGKGYNLGRMEAFGFNVPTGLILSSAAYRAFIEHNTLDTLMDKVSTVVTGDNVQENTSLLQELGGCIEAGEMPQPVRDEVGRALADAGLNGSDLVVRSSATLEDGASLSFAGIHESFLNIKGREPVINAVKKCYASLWTPRAVAYRRRFAINDQEVLAAVVIMEMVPALASGVAFSCDPRTGRRDRLVVNAAPGLGDALVNGLIEPDIYILDPSPFYVHPRVVEKTIGSKNKISMANPDGGVSLVENHTDPGLPALADEEIARLGTLVIRVFDSLGEAEQHQDIEWAYDGKEFHLLQARPATAIPRYTFEAMKAQAEIWSNGNYRDACPMVLSPLHRRMMKEIVDVLQYESLAICKYPIPEGFQFARFVKGRLYCDTTALLWANYDCFGIEPAMYTPFWGGHHPDLEIPNTDQPSAEQLQAWQQYNEDYQAVVAQTAPHMERYFASMNTVIDEIMAARWDELADEDFSGLFARAGGWLAGYSKRYLVYNSVGGLAFGGMLQMLYPHFGDGTMAVINGMMAGGASGITSADHGYRLLELALQAGKEKEVAGVIRSDDFEPRAWEAALPEGSEFKNGLRQFIKDFGHRALYELDIINPRWHEDPSYLFDFIRDAMDVPGTDRRRWAQREANRRSREQAAALLDDDQMRSLEDLVRQAQKGAAVREANKSIMARGLEIYRQMALEMGRRLYRKGLLDEAAEVFFCTWPELLSIFDGGWGGQGLTALVAFRRQLFQEYSSLEAPDYIMDEKPAFGRIHPRPEGNWLQGLGASAGMAKGPARLIAHPAEGNRLLLGEVMVAPSTDPAWTPLFLKAAALIMETGGFLSHGAIVAREYGIPSVINVAGAMHHLQDGRRVTVDGDMGRVYLD